MFQSKEIYNFRIRRYKFYETVCYSLLILLAYLTTNPTFISIVYLTSFAVTFYFNYKVKRLNIISLYFFVYLIFNLYILIPCINYLILDKILFLASTEQHYNDPHFIYFSEYLVNSIVGITMYSLISKQQVGKIKTGLELSFNNSLAVVLLGYSLLLFQLLYTGALFEVTNGGFFREKIGQFPPIYIYFLYPGLYLCFKNSTNNIQLLLSFLCLALYSLFVIYAGTRGAALAAFFVCSAGYFRMRHFIIRRKYIVRILALFLVFMIFTIKARMPDNQPNLSIVEFLKRAPQFANPGTVEYGTSYYNYSILQDKSFQQDFPFQIYLEQFIGPTSISPTGEKVSVFYKYRDTYHAHRKITSGSSGGTGYSLQYEFLDSLGPYLYWVMYLIMGFIFYHINQKNKYSKTGISEIYTILIIPYLITIARSNFMFAILFTKLIYAIVVFCIISVLIKKKFPFKVKRLIHG